MLDTQHEQSNQQTLYNQVPGPAWQINTKVCNMVRHLADFKKLQLFLADLRNPKMMRTTTSCAL